MNITDKFIPPQIVREGLLFSIENYKITIETLSKVTRLDTNWLIRYLNNKKVEAIPIEDYGCLFDLATMLSRGMLLPISSEERINSIIDVLTQIFKVDYETIALYAKLEIEEIEAFVKNPESVSHEKKLTIATTVMMLHYLFKYPEIEKQNDTLKPE